MSIVRLATIPGSVCPSEHSASRVRKPIQSFGWQTLLRDAYPVIGLVLIVSYLAWVVVLGDSSLPWVGELASVE